MGKARRRKQERAPAPERIQAAAPRADRPRPAHRVPTLCALAPLLLIAVGAALYANSFAVPFLFDDHFDILGNPFVEKLQSPLFYLTHARGLTELTFALNRAWGGTDVWGYHLVNVLVHLINSVLVFLLVLGTLRLPYFEGRYRRHAAALALFVALVFLAHPLQTMAATYLVQRSESLAALFYLLTLLLVLRGAGATSSGGRAAWYGAALLAGLLGILSKQTAATLPLTALLYHLCFLSGERSRPRARGWLIFALLLLPLAYGLYLSRHYLMAPAGVDDGVTPRAWLYIPTAGLQLGVAPLHYLLTQAGVVVWYLRLFALPTRLCFDYGWPLVDSPWQAGVLLPLLGLLALAAAAVWSFRRYRLATFCLGWFFLTLAPSSSVIPLSDAAFEYRMYLPLVGLAWLTVVGAHDALRALAARRGAADRVPWRAAAGAAALWVVALGALTVARNSVYRSELRLDADSAAKAPGNWRAQFNYGSDLVRAGRADEAVPHLQEAVRLAPEMGTPRVQLGSIYLQKGRLDEAEAVLEPATKVLEESVVAAAYRQIGFIRQSRGDLDGALAAYGRALDLKRDWGVVNRQMARIHASRGEWGYAANHYNDLIERDPKMGAGVRVQAAEANFHAGVGMLEYGDHEHAVDFLEHAVRLRPEDAAAHHYLAVALSRLGRWDEAKEQLELAARYDPDDFLVYKNLLRARLHRWLLAPPAAAQ